MAKMKRGELSKAIKELAATGLAQKDIVAKLGCAASYVSNVLSGKTGKSKGTHNGFSFSAKLSKLVNRKGKLSKEVEEASKELAEVSAAIDALKVESEAAIKAESEAALEALRQA